MSVEVPGGSLRDVVDKVFGADIEPTATFAQAFAVVSQQPDFDYKREMSALGGRDDRYEGVMVFKVLVCGFDTYSGDPELIGYVLGYRPVLVGVFLDAYEAGIIKTRIDTVAMCEYYDLADISTCEPGTFARLVQRGDLIIDTEWLRRCLQRSLCGAYVRWTDDASRCVPKQRANLASMLLDWAPDDGCAVQALVAEERHKYTLEIVQSSCAVKLKEDDQGTKLSTRLELLARPPSFGQPIFEESKWRERLDAVNQSYTRALARMTAYKSALVPTLVNALEHVPLVLCTLVASYMLPK